MHSKSKNLSMRAQKMMNSLVFPYPSPRYGEDKFMILSRFRSCERSIPKIMSIGRQTNKQNLGYENIFFISLLANQTLMNSSFQSAQYKGKQRMKRQKKNQTVLENIINRQKKLSKASKNKWEMSNSKGFPSYLKNISQEHQNNIYQFRQQKSQSVSNSFHIKIENANCFDGVFPNSRLNGVMISVDEKQRNMHSKILLIGGLSPQMGRKLHFHQYSLLSRDWKQFPIDIPQCPQFNLSQHAALEYKHRVYIIGGIAVIPSIEENKNQRYNIPFISCFHLQKMKWARINWSVYLRAHVVCCIGKFAMIDGGITQQNKHNNKIYLFDLEKTQSPTALVQSGLGLAYHRIISTEKVDEKIKNFLKVQGLICFGGKFQSGIINHHVYHLHVEYKQNQLFDRFSKLEWSELSCSGIAPPPRYMHSMNLLNLKSQSFEKKAYSIIIGGMTHNDVVLSDVWLLDLFNLEWIELSFFEKSSHILKKQIIKQLRGIAGHCAGTTLNQIFIFGGFDGDRKQNSEFWSIGYEKIFRKGKLLSRNKGRKKNSFESSDKYIQ